MPGTITTLTAEPTAPTDVSVDDGGTVFVADPELVTGRVLRVDGGQVTTTLLGTLGHSPLHGLAASDPAQDVSRPGAVAALPNGVAIVASGNACVVKVDAGVVRLLAGWVDGPRCAAPAGLVFDPDGATATRTVFGDPAGIVVDGALLYVADAGGNRVRRIDSVTGTITTFAGGRGTRAARDVALRPRGLLAAGNLLWITDVANGIVRVMSTTTGAQAPAAGNGVIAVTTGSDAVTDEGPALFARLPRPTAVARDARGTLWVADAGQRRIWRIDAGTDDITLLPSQSPGGPELAIPEALAIGPDGALYVAESDDLGQGRVLRIDVASEPPIVTTVAGGGDADPGDGQPPATVRLRATGGLAFGADGRLFVSESGRHSIRVIDVAADTITTIAGSGQRGRSDADVGTDADFAEPTALLLDGAGGLLVADTANDALRYVSPTPPHAVTTVGGNGSAAPVDGVHPLETGFRRPRGLAVDATGAVYVADEGNAVVRRIAGGVVTTIAGNGHASWSGDGGQAHDAQLSRPRAVARDGVGHVFIVDQGNHVIRRVDVATGVIATYAGRPGGHTDGPDGDGGPAIDAQFLDPTSVAFDGAGNLYVSDTGHQRIRRIAAAPPHVVTTVAGTGDWGSSGDGGPATEATLADPRGLDVGPEGALYVAQRGSIRVIDDVANAPGIVVDPPSTTTTTSTPTTTIGSSTLVPGSTTSTTQPPFSPRPPSEICGDCADNDGDGMVDFEDDDCCRAHPVLAIALDRAHRLRRRDGTSLDVRAALVGAVAAGLEARPQNVVVQLRRPDKGPLFCAYVPATVFLARRKRALVTYTDRRGTIGGIRALALRTRGGDLRLRLRARTLPFALARDETVRFTVGFRDVLNAHHCATVEQTVR